MVSAEFSLLPSRKIYPDYYQVTAKPIDLKQIATKIQKGEYSALDGLVDDLTLLANNAVQYNVPSSQIHKVKNNSLLAFLLALFRSFSKENIPDGVFDNASFLSIIGSGGSEEICGG